MNNKKNILGGLVLIVFAVCLILDKMNQFPDLPLLKIGVLLLLVVVFFDALRKLEFVGVMFPVGVAGWMFQDEIGLGTVPGYIILIAAFIIGIGLSMIFSRKKYNFVEKKYNDGSCSYVYSDDDGYVCIDNNFGSKTEYVSSKDIKKADIDNGMGNLAVYFNGSTINSEGAEFDIDNGLGTLSLYFPKEFRMKFNTENGLGKVTTHGQCSEDPEAPLIKVKLDNGLGTVDIYFE